MMELSATRKNCLTDEELSKTLLELLIAQGVEEFCFCPGARNACLLYPLVHASQIRLFYWPEERSAAFFALGRIKSHGKPVAVVVTSGTAAAELLSATMEAYYTSLPLILVTADRPRRFRGTGSPQSAEQVGLFGPYVKESYDYAIGDDPQINLRGLEKPLHINLCFEEPNDLLCQQIRLGEIEKEIFIYEEKRFSDLDKQQFQEFISQSRYPFVIVGALPINCQEEMIEFLTAFGAPLYLESTSQLREEKRLQHLRISHVDNLFGVSHSENYPIDGVLRIGGVPTLKSWRDLERMEGKIRVCSVSQNPFSGLSFGGVIHTSIRSFCLSLADVQFFNPSFSKWKAFDDNSYESRLNLYQKFPRSSAALIHELSKIIPLCSRVYLGNSLPIRDWDAHATLEAKHFYIEASRGVNGIDGQVSTFLGFCSPDVNNFAIVGDLTALYDLAAYWIAGQLAEIDATVVIVNNGGAGIFSRMFSHPAFQNQHNLSFEHLAKMWGWHYERWESIPKVLPRHRGFRLVELIEDTVATSLFIQEAKEIS